MFKKETEAAIPTNLFECYETDNISNNLFSWASAIEMLGKIFAILTFIVALIWLIGFIAMDGDEYMIPIVLAIPVAAVIEYLSFHTVALLIGALGKIVKSTHITANITLYNAAKSEFSHICPCCGEKIAYGSTKCKCGQKFKWQ